MICVSMATTSVRTEFILWLEGSPVYAEEVSRSGWYAKVGKYDPKVAIQVHKSLQPWLEKFVLLDRVAMEGWNALTKESLGGRANRHAERVRQACIDRNIKPFKSYSHDPRHFTECREILAPLNSDPSYELLVAASVGAQAGFWKMSTPPAPVKVAVAQTGPSTSTAVSYWEDDYFDFRRWIADKLKIRTKARRVDPFVERPAQTVILDVIEAKRRAKQPVDIDILKSRQLGATTVIQAVLFALIVNLPNASAFIVSHTKRSAKTITAMCRRFYNNLDRADLPPLEGNKVTNEGFIFAHPHDSQLSVATALGDEIGRSDMLHYVHASEVPFWENAEDVALGLWSCVPGPAESWDTIKIKEGTANGAQGYFYDDWNSAHEEGSTTVPIFTGFLLDPLARHEIAPGEKFHLDADEEEYFEKYGDIVHVVRDVEYRLTLEIMKWARWTRRNKCKGSWERFNQEYPISAEVAFLFAGYPIFNRRIVKNMLDVATEPELVGDLEWDSATAPYLRFESDHHGKLKIWSLPVAGRSYSVAMDPCQGVGADWAVVHVVDDESNDHIAEWRDNRTSMAMQGLEAFRLSVWYNYGKLCIENNIGHSSLVVCERGLYGHPQTKGGYPNLYYETRTGKKDEEETEVLGFTTTKKSKNDALDILRRAVLSGEFHTNSRTLLLEMLGYSYDPVKRKHMQTYKDPHTGMFHDDEIMAQAMAQVMRERAQDPGADYFGKAEVVVM